MAKRLLREHQAIIASPSPALELLEPSESDIYDWSAILLGPENTPYEGGKWRVRIKVPTSYPIDPPTMQFETRICHPNIHFETGEVCIDVLKTQWTPAWTLASALLAIQAMLSDPEPDSPLNIDAANLVRSGEITGYEQLVNYYKKVYTQP
ncbi:Ubiquitin-conjugating enzyme E2 pex4 [Wickerhamiella sorbophila]|uniref:Ubiquitin-conjugating enzyme E2 pex4 n=1 Tax=Wickerhamiella sorbophila TaxID=45607 RepID=A0A2T0FP28_9ASCO|nr:Ubiquitin-conjugating enzyme E2 pex4 [Wickerhamiella sorbophila]PRT56735.1 Ubiquitin-conjugating enzyme E2 pex4 [Wickerhamiella sorbophila]